MANTPVRIGPSRPRDALLALAALLLLAAVPVGVLLLTLAFAAAVHGGHDVVLTVGLFTAAAACVAVPLPVMLRSRRAGYELLPVAAVLAPFLPTLWLCLGLPGL
ncbi:hypothetical protein J5Y04_23645 [Kitasatospora sp. RG8]|uniref:hypothetical protein n=1 Tax=Kitasatospora sp. RG8 TaxID=2820815 RepID=UPI001ADFD5DB|nr:hypothetical protein [Kitasatospora sp. RG8]MBP0452514.1 hypothetical protein [Kitasatospora sp. RG8]